MDQQAGGRGLGPQRRMPSMTCADGSAPLSGSQSRSQDDALAMALRRMHASIADEPLPDEIKAVLDQIDADLSGKDQKS